MTRATKLDLGDYLPYLVNRVGSIIADQFGAGALARHDLSIAMWRVMAALAANGSQRQIDLADLTSIEVSTLSRLITRLIRKGLVTRTRSTNSNREVAVRLTPKGQSLVNHLIPIALDCKAALHPFDHDINSVTVICRIADTYLRTNKITPRID